MAASKIRPVHGGFAAIVAVAMISATPVLAAPDRGLCDDAATTALDIKTTEFSTTADADESIELLGPNFEFAAREKSVTEDEQSEQSESAADEDTDGEAGNPAAPADSGPLVNKRQMYRRDI